MTTRSVREYKYCAPRPTAPSTSSMLVSTLMGGVLYLIGMLLLALFPIPTPTAHSWFLAGTVTAIYFIAAYTLLHFEYKSRPFTISLADLPLVMSIMLVSPWLVIPLRLLAMIIAGILHKKSLHRQIFNGGFVLFETAVAYFVFGLFPFESVHEPLAWFAAIATIFILNILGFGVVVAYASILDGNWPTTKGLKYALGTLVAGGVVCAISGVFAALSLTTSLWAAPLAALAVVTVTESFKVRGELSQQSRAIQEFRRTTELAECNEHDVMYGLMKQACAMVHADVANVRVYPKGEDVDLDALEARTAPWWSKLLPSISPARHKKIRCLLSRGDGVHAVIEVFGKRPEVGRFTSRDITTLVPLVGHAEGTWRSTYLVEKLRKDARRDTVTNIGNRAFLHDEIAKSSVPGLVAVIRCLTIPKVITGFGVATADSLMIQIASRLQDCSAKDPQMRVARIGDDSFGVWLPSGHESSLHAIERAVAHPIGHGSVTISMSFVFGYTEIDAATSPHVALDQAHTAMVTATQFKTNTPIRYDAAYAARTRDRLQLSEDLRLAIADETLSLSYQPKVCATTGRVLGCEALARWNHPDHGVIPPQHFVELAEQTDQISTLSRYVLKTATQACGAWQDIAPGVGVSVNVSTIDMADPAFTTVVDEAIESAGIDPGLLTLEVTESDMILDADATIITLTQLRSRGLRISVDDFGTGYSSLSYLRNLPIDEAKIDKSFIISLETDRTGLTMVSHIVSMIHALGVDVVAEGVESTIIGKQLANISCDVLQGYGVSWPLSSDALNDWFTARSSKRAPGALPSEVDISETVTHRRTSM